jgi:hypothetical protein
MAEARGQIWTEVREVPRAFAHGLLGGFLGPVLALGGAVGLLYLLTRQLPAVKDVTRSDGQEGKAITLAPPAEARASWARYAGALRGAMIELRARRQARRE